MDSIYDESPSFPAPTVRQLIHAPTCLQLSIASRMPASGAHARHATFANNFKTPMICRNQGKIWEYNRIPIEAMGNDTHLIWIKASQQCLLHAPCTDNINDLKNKRWLFGEVCDHVGIYESKAAEGLSAIYVGLVNTLRSFPTTFRVSIITLWIYIYLILCVFNHSLLVSRYRSPDNNFWSTKHNSRYVWLKAQCLVIC